MHPRGPAAERRYSSQLVVVVVGGGGGRVLLVVVVANPRRVRLAPHATHTNSSVVGVAIFPPSLSRFLFVADQFRIVKVPYVGGLICSLGGSHRLQYSLCYMYIG